MTWVAVLAGSACCYLLKLAGLSMPRSVLDHPRVRRTVELLPVALLAALAASQAFGVGRELAVDARAAGLAVGIAAIALRAPFLVVVALAAGTAALIRAVA
jgi:uncharacterized membrane protein